MKTLHPGVHGGILARRDLPGHVAALHEHGIALIDLVRSCAHAEGASLRQGGFAAVSASPPMRVPAADLLQPTGTGASGGTCRQYYMEHVCERS